MVDEALTPPAEQLRLDPLAWAELRRMFDSGPMHVPGPLRDLYLDLSPKIVLMKGAQLGCSEWAINRGVWVADQGHAVRGNSLYVLPGGQHVGDFVQARVNPAIQSSPYLLGRIRPDGNTKDPDKVGLRRIGRGYTYFRTSGSRAGLRTVDADLIILDEFDEMADWVLPMAEHRLDSSRAPMTVLLGTPTAPGIGIDVQYLGGDQRRYELSCMTCDTWQVLDWARSVEVAGDPVHDDDAVAALLCIQCGDDLAPTVALAWATGERGRWRPMRPAGQYHSYHLSQLYRPGTDLLAIARGLRSPQPEVRREVQNQSLGLPYSEVGGRLTEAELQRASVGPSRAAMAAAHGTFMGVDIGARLHCYVGVMEGGLPTMVDAFEVDDFDQLDAVMRRYDVRYCVADANPELHAAHEFKDRHPGRVWLAYYKPDKWPMTWTDRDDEQHRPLADPRKRYIVTVDRSAVMDGVVARIRGESSELYGWQPLMALASDAFAVPGFFDMLTAPERNIVHTVSGKTRAVWDEGSRPDHYFHSLVYAQCAYEIMASGPHATPFVWV